MTKFRTLLVDDEPLARSNIRSLLRQDTQIDIVGECSSGSEALSGIRETKPDLLFLDVEMPECDGFDVLELFGGKLPPAIIFVTAYEKYALRAFESGALDYLLKPFDDARFHLALERAKQRIVQDRLNPRASDTISLKSAGQVLFLKIADIDWIEAADYYSCLHVGAKSHLLRRSMADLEQQLDPNFFCRVHRSTIVKLDRVQSLELSESGEYDVLLKSGATLKLSRSYRKNLQKQLETRNWPGR